MQTTWLHFVIVFLLSLAVAAEQDGCQKVSSSSSGWTVQCETYIIDYVVNSEVKVTCTRFVSPYAPDLFTGYNVSETTTFHFVECPPPENSFGQVLAGMEVTILLYQVYNHIIDLESNLFLGLPDLKILYLCSQTRNITPEDIFWHLNQLLVLQLSINLSSVPENLFRNLTSLVSLQFMDQNSFTTLPKDVFSDLGNLQNLILDNGALQDLPTQIFFPLTQLQMLSLRNNQFKSISSTHLNRLSNLEYFYMSGNKLEVLNGDLFQGNPSLGELDLGSNPTLPSLPYNLLQNLTHLQNLTIRDCNFTDIPDMFFSYASNLERIYMQNNRLVNISSVIFSKNPKLKEINMLYNDVSNITADAFANLRDLKTFILGKNNIVWFPDGLFDKMEHLSILDSSSTFLQAVQPDLFRSLHHLRVLMLRNNVLMTVTGKEPFGPGTNLEVVDLSYNNLLNISGIDWSVYGRLKQLHLRYNLLDNYALPVLQTERADVFLGYSRIRRVAVNELQEYIDATPVNASKSSAITFYMDANPFHCDCHMLRFAEFINRTRGRNKSYDVRFHRPENYVCQEPWELHFKPLIFIDKEEFVCKIRDESCPESCDCYIRGFDNATVVDCNARGLTSLPTTLPFNTTELYVSQNKLTSIDSWAWMNLTLLDVSENEIQSNNWLMPSTLTELRLQGNRMTWLPFSVQTLVETNPGARVYLGNNPFPCNCSVKDLKNLLTTQAKCFPDIENISCTTSGPDPVTHLMIDFSEAELCPSEDG